jgi:hypothetical protein
MSLAVMIGREEKENALTLLESSATFARQGQLKEFLRFVCEYEIAGKGGDLHEYLIGTEVLGQPIGYSTADNSVVRNRAHTLRRKLQDFYTLEAPDAAIRIEIPKGSYCPQFVFAPSRQGSPTLIQEPAAEIALPQTAPKWFSSKARSFTAAAIIVCLTTGLIGYWLGMHRKESVVAPVIREAWGPLLDPGAHTMICISTVPELLVRSVPGVRAGDWKRAPTELELDSWFRQRYKEGLGEHLFLEPNFNSPLWGDASGALSIYRVLDKAGIDVQVLPERVQDAFAMRDRNVILLGRPENSPAADLYLHDLYYKMRYFEDILDQEIYYDDPQTGAAKPLQHQPDITHGLITVIGSSDRPTGPTRIVVISGVNSAGAIGAAEFFSSADHMQEFKTRLQHDGYKSFPTVYQIVTSTETQDVLPFRSWMVTYKVITR